MNVESLTDETAVVQAAADNCQQLEPRLYNIRETIRINNRMGGRLAGGGGIKRSTAKGWEKQTTATVLQYTGDPEQPILHCSGTTGLTLERLTLIGQTAIGILFNHGIGTLNNTLDKISIIGPKTGIQHGTSEGEQTCANLTYNACYWQDCLVAIKLVNTQSLEHLLLSPKFALCNNGISVEHGGDIQIIGGGSYELGTLLTIDDAGSNTQGYWVTGFRFDGKKTKTAWLDFVNPTRPRSAGVLTFEGCQQNRGQRVSDKPVFTVCPGARVRATACNFNVEEKWLRDGQLVHIHGSPAVRAEFIAEHCGGLSGPQLHTYAKLIAPNASAKFNNCGNLYQPTRSLEVFR